MRLRSLPLTIPVAVLVATLVALPTPTAAQQPMPPGQPDDGYEVLARGPVHEAYAATAEFPVAGPVVAKQPPAPIEELPPAEKPAGENVQWIPGYWSWDEERTDFIWVSGFWREPPPGRVWVPGDWHEVQGGWQWVQGFWQGTTTDQPGAPQAQLEYLPPPPEPLNAAVVPAPSPSYFFVPGCWVWRDHYVWRPGFWMELRPGWVWVPAHYKWTPIGYVFVPGYWDYELVRRGVLFAPVAFTQVVIARPAFVYTPTYVVSYRSMFTSLFVRRGWGSYFFGDYFGRGSIARGYIPWAAPALALNANLGRRAAYDPLWAYYQTAYRGQPQWTQSVTNVFAGRYRGEYPRPPHTLRQQAAVVNAIASRADANKSVVSNVTMVAPISRIQSVVPANAKIELTKVRDQERVREQQLAKEFRQLAAQRQRLEAKLAAQSPAPKQPPALGQPVPKHTVERPRQVTLSVPKQAVARAQAPKAPPLPKQLQDTQPKRPKQPTPPVQEPKQPKRPPVNPLPPPQPQPSAPKQPKGQPPMQPKEPKKPQGPPPVNPMHPTPPVPQPGQPQPKQPKQPKSPPGQPQVPPAPLPKQPKKPVLPPTHPMPPPVQPARPKRPQEPKQPPAPKQPGQVEPKGKGKEPRYPPAIPVPKGAPVRPNHPQQPQKPHPAPTPPRPAGTPPPVQPKAPPPAPKQPGKSAPKPEKGKGQEKKKDKDKDDKKK
ncbi:MAG TPA: hypothetical protein VFG68_06570 [Fimbriiglobus sp.]|nr:hypothetical protein [Fimbriiglobus sp.]